jgi:hypothetical protein
MPIQVADRIEQANRGGRLETPEDFFYTMNGSDIDFSVDGILENNNDPFDTIVGKKYIIRNISAVGLPPTSGVSINANDIITYDGSNGMNWVLYKRVSNAETNFGIVYDKSTKLVYQYDETNGWLPLLRKNGTIDGGTF